MENHKVEKTLKKCYNSWSCALSVLIIVFVLGSIVYDYTYSKPRMQKDIKEIKIEVQEIHDKIEKQNIMYFISAENLDTIQSGK